MSDADSGSQRLSDEERFDEIVADYLDAVAAGDPIDEAAWLDEHSEFADALNSFFADHRRMNGMLNVNEQTDTSGAGDAPTTGASEASDRSFHHAGRFDDYLLIDPIAQGGMGVVYRARQLSLNRVVALKMIRAGEFADSEEIARFRAEAEAAAQLQHPGIVPIYQIGEDRGQHFFSMALVEGTSLAHLVKEGLSPKQAATYVMKVARAVHYAHEQGIIHRDIKPANILVDENSEPLVTDFGLAKRIEADSQITMSGQILGTASYMPPEQAEGQAVTPKSDVYSLGAVLYALLAKRPPFIGDNPMDILMDVLSKEAPSLSSHRVGISRDLETICLRCLQKDASKRYESAEALAEDLERFLDGHPILARPIGRIEKTIRWCRRKPAYTAVIFLASLLIASSAGYVISYSMGLTRAYNDGRFDTETDPGNNVERAGLLKTARKFYGDNPLKASTQITQQAYIDAGVAMLHYVHKDAAAQPLFESLAQTLSQLVAEQPDNPEWKSALADCHWQLARYLCMDGVLVSEEKAAREHLEAAQQLLVELQTSHPNNSHLLARHAAVRVNFRELSGTTKEKQSHFSEAIKISREFTREWERSLGLVRFDMAPPSISPLSVEAAEQLLEKANTAENYLQLAYALRSASPPQDADAIDAYRTAHLLRKDTDVIPPELIQQAFTEQAVLAEIRPDDFRRVSKKTWPRDPKEFYYAVLGMRMVTR